MRQNYHHTVYRYLFFAIIHHASCNSDPAKVQCTLYVYFNGFSILRENSQCFLTDSCRKGNHWIFSRSFALFRERCIVGCDGFDTMVSFKNKLKLMHLFVHSLCIIFILRLAPTNTLTESLKGMKQTRDFGKSRQLLT